jgi:uncharacterized repeat protein (TIGR01451 family)
MKRLVLRLSALSLVVVLGLIAIARGQRVYPLDNSDPAPQASSDPFANSSNLTEAPERADANASRSSVRLVSVQDVPSGTGPVPPRSVPNTQEPPAAATDPFGLHCGGVNQASASASDISPSPAPAAPSSGHSIYLGPTPTDAPMEVAQAPATLEPPVGAAPLPIPPQATAPEQIAPSAYGTSALGAPGFAAPQSFPQPAAQANPEPPLQSVAQPTVATQNENPPGMTIGSLRPVDPEPSPGMNMSSNITASAAVSGADAALPAAGPIRPDSKHVEGLQSPQLSIEKMAPAEVQVGKPARFELRVRNSGTAAAQGVEIHDAVPQGTQFISSNPPTTQGPDGQLAWSLGELKPGEQTSVQLELMPVAEGDIRSMATVTFRTEVSVHTLATRPRLVVQLTGPKQVLIGDEAMMTVRISNPGTGTATGVVLSERVPPGLRHKAGSDLEFEVGTLKPGQSRQIELSMSAVEPGHVINSLQAHGDAKLRAQARVEFDVVAPALSVAMTGPTRRYLERQATYTVAVSNPGTAPARDVELVTQLPQGMKFVKANNAGHYDPQTHTVTWNLEELPPSETGSVTLVAMPIEAGEQHMKIQGKARQGLTDAKEKTVVVEGLAAVTFDVRAADEAIEVGGETTYQIHVVNEGSIAASNLQITALFPPELKPLHADGPGRGMIDRRTAAAGFAVQFEPMARLEPKGEATYRVRAQAIQPGDLRVKVEVQTDDMHQPVTKEENTRVYVDH